MSRPPWLQILRSGPFWGLLTVHMGYNFIATNTGTFLPIYLNDVLKFDVTMVWTFNSSLKKRLTYWWCDLPLRWIFKWYNIIIILQNGLASSLPPLARFLASLGGGHISDLLISRETFSITVVRKIFMTTGKIVKLKKLKYTISLSTMTYLGL